MAHADTRPVEAEDVERIRERRRRASERGRWRAVEEAFEAGLRNHWYALAPASALEDANPFPLRRMGEDLVLWRDASGAPHLFVDSCAHRGAKLSLGAVVGDRLCCCYHGWAYDGTGQCVSIPSEGGACELAREARVRSYPVEEHGGLIFGWFDDDGRAPGRDCPNPEELESPEWSGFIVPHEWHGIGWFRVLKNLVDPIHAPFLHAGTYTMGHGALQDVIAVEDRPDGLFVKREGQELVSFDYSTYHFPNWCEVDVPYPWTAGPGGVMRVLVFVTPIDREATQVYMVRKRRIAGWKWWIWWSLWHLRLRRKMYDVLDGDEAALTSQRGRDALDNEFLAQSDLGIVRMRRLFADAHARLAR